MSNKSTNTRDKIIDTTINIIGQEGFAYATAGNISKEGGFKKSIIFYYFENIDELLFESLAKSIKKLSPILKLNFDDYNNIKDYLNKSIYDLISSQEGVIYLKVILSFVHKNLSFKDSSEDLYNIIIDDLYISLAKAINNFKNLDMTDDEIETLSSLIMTTFNGLGVILLMDGSNEKFIANWNLQVDLIGDYIKSN